MNMCDQQQFECQGSESDLAGASGSGSTCQLALSPTEDWAGAGGSTPKKGLAGGYSQEAPAPENLAQGHHQSEGSTRRGKTHSPLYGLTWEERGAFTHRGGPGAGTHWAPLGSWLPQGIYFG